MTIVLPVLPQASQTTFTLVSSSVTQTPTLGGPTQRIGRLGDRWQAQVTNRSLTYAQAIGYIAALNQGMANKLAFPVPQPGLTIGTPGTPVVSSGSGTSISITGFSANYAVKAGQFFSVINNGLRYLHQVVSAVTASGAGSATLTIQPMLKVTLNVGSTCEFAQPYLEGFLSQPSQSWSVGLNNTVQGLAFTIIEAN